MEDREELQKRVLEEEDYVRAPKFLNSLTKFLARNSDGVENATIARLLMIPEEQVEKLHAEAIQMLRDDMVGDET